MIAVVGLSGAPLAAAPGWAQTAPAQTAPTQTAPTIVAPRADTPSLPPGAGGDVQAPAPRSENPLRPEETGRPLPDPGISKPPVGGPEPAAPK